MSPVPPPRGIFFGGSFAAGSASRPFDAAIHLPREPWHPASTATPGCARCAPSCPVIFRCGASAPGPWCGYIPSSRRKPNGAMLLQDAHRAQPFSTTRAFIKPKRRDAPREPRGQTTLRHNCLSRLIIKRQQWVMGFGAGFGPRCRRSPENSSAALESRLRWMQTALNMPRPITLGGKRVWRLPSYTLSAIPG